MWVRFWYSYDRDNPPMDEQNDCFQWLHDHYTDEILKDDALEKVPDHCRYNDSGQFYYGFERLNSLPEKVRNRLIIETEDLITESKNKIAWAERFLDNVLRAGK